MRKILVVIMMLCMFAALVAADDLVGSSVIYPNGGEVLTIGQLVSISFTKETNGVAPVKYDLDYSDNSGSGWNLVATNLSFETDVQWSCDAESYSNTYVPTNSGVHINVTTDSKLKYVLAKVCPNDESSWVELQLKTAGNCSGTTLATSDRTWTHEPSFYTYRQLNFTDDYVLESGTEYDICFNSNNGWMGATYIGSDIGTNIYMIAEGIPYPTQDYMFKIYTEPATTYEWNTTGISQSDEYLVRARSKDDSNTSTWDESNATFTMREYNAPTNSTILYPNGGEVIADSIISINYTESTDLDNDTIHYELGYSNNSGSDWVELGNDTAPPYSWDWTGLPYLSTYQARVRACDDTLMCSDYDASDADFQLCVPDWQCDLYGDCLTNNTRNCIAAEDLNNCSINYTGNYSEFTPDVCDYCTPAWSCTTYQNYCPAWHTKNCITVSDSNNCYPQTGLPSDDFDGNFSPYVTTCGYNSTFTTTDLRSQTTDVIGTGLQELVRWVRVVVTVSMILFVFFGSIRVGLDKLGVWKLK
jgi:hypothetical protein